jgi:hypothetical protein
MGNRARIGVLNELNGKCVRTVDAPISTQENDKMYLCVSYRTNDPIGVAALTV